MNIQTGRGKTDLPLICITGICGFVGSRLAHLLVRQGYDVCGCDNLSTGRRDNLPDTLQEKRDWVQLDLTEKGATDRLVALIEAKRGHSKRKIHIVHAACPSYDAASDVLFTYVTRGVTVGTSATLAAAIRVNAARFIFFSGLARYRAIRPGERAVDHREEDLSGDASSPYGVAKRGAEEQIRILLSARGIPWTILVPPPVFGVGQEYNIPGRNIAAGLLNLAIHGKDLPIHGDGRQQRVFTPWSAIEAPLVEICTNAEGHFDGLVLNVGPSSKHGMEVKVFCQVIVRVASQVTGRTLRPALIPISHVGLAAGTRRSAFCDMSRYRSIFGGSITDGAPDIERELMGLARVILARPSDFRYGVYRQHADLPLGELPEYAQRGLFSIAP